MVVVEFHCYNPTTSHPRYEFKIETHILRVGNKIVVLELTDASHIIEVNTSIDRNGIVAP